MRYENDDDDDVGSGGVVIVTQSIYNGPGIALSALRILIYLILMTNFLKYVLLFPFYK